MADPAIGFDRSIETTAYSPPVNGEHGLADRLYRPPAPPSEARDSASQELASLIKLGTLKLEMGNDAEATELFRKALEIADCTLGPDHPDLILLLNDVTRLYLKQSAYGAAEPLLLRLLDMKRSKGEDHPEVATVLASLAAVRQALGRHESAEQLWRRVLDIRERTLAPNHFAIATALEHLGDACAARGNIVEALSAFQRAQTIRERTLGSGHSSIQTSRERIADLQLQASENSLEQGSDVPTVPAPERYRLLSGEQTAITAPAPPAREKTVREKPASSRSPAARIGRQAKATIQHGFSDAPPLLAFSASEEAEPHQMGELDPSPVTYQANDVLPYRDALESVWDELESADTGPSLTERSAAVLESVMAFLGRRQVIAGTVVVVLGLLSLAVARASQAGGELDLAAGIGAPPSQDPAAMNVGAKNTAIQPAIPTREPAPVPVTTAANSSTKNAVSKSRVVEEKDSPRKAAEGKTDGKKISIPALESGVMSRLDSVATRAADVSSRVGDPVAIQPSLNNIGNHRSSFDYPEQSTDPQRARLIGELPTPRVPERMADIEGEVRVRFNVDTNGVPVMSTFAVVNSPSPLLTVAVRKVIPEMRFEPARSGGPGSKPIVDVVQIGFQFSRAR